VTEQIVRDRVFRASPLAPRGFFDFFLVPRWLMVVGLVLAGLAMVFARQSMTMNEGTGAVLYLLCGVVFPPDLLPRILHPLSLALPVTWWMEASRRTLGVRDFSALLSVWSDGAVAAAFLLVTAVWVAGALLAFARLERRARRLGLLDVTTAF